VGYRLLLEWTGEQPAAANDQTIDWGEERRACPSWQASPARRPWPGCLCEVRSSL